MLILIRYTVRENPKNYSTDYLTPCTENLLSGRIQILAKILYWIFSVYKVYVLSYMISLIFYHHHTQMNLQKLIRFYIIKLYI
jgi:hypothetical protein